LKVKLDDQKAKLPISEIPSKANQRNEEGGKEGEEVEAATSQVVA